MKIIGICGTSGSGKSTVCKILSKHGVAVLDCDEIYHRLTRAPSPCLEAVRTRFGDGVIKDGKLDRSALKSIVFRDDKALLDLNAITHKFVLSELSSSIKQLQKQGAKACVIDAPLFFEAHLETWCDLVCAVISDPKQQILRICNRDGISREEAILRLEKQISSEELRRRCDYVIENNYDETALEKSCQKFLKHLNL